MNASFQSVRKWAVQTARLCCGVPDYEVYVKHLQLLGQNLTVYPATVVLPLADLHQLLALHISEEIGFVVYYQFPHKNRHPKDHNPRFLVLHLQLVLLQF